MICVVYNNSKLVSLKALESLKLTLGVVLHHSTIIYTNNNTNKLKDDNNNH